MYKLIFVACVLALATSREIRVITVQTTEELVNAVKTAIDSDTIRISPGRYKLNNLTIDKAITIIGIDGAILDGSHKNQILLIKSDSVNIYNLTFENAGVSFVDDNASIKLDGVKQCKIIGNKIYNSFFGIYLAKSADTEIKNNFLEAYSNRETTSGNGIHLWYSKNIRIEENTVKGHRDGIYFEFVEDSKVINNLTTKNLRYGLHFMFSNHCLYEKNRFVKNGAGVAVMFTRYVTMQYNVFEENWGSAAYGLLLKEIYDSKIINNLFIKNSIAIYSESSTRNLISKNDFNQNGWALKMMANSMDNKIMSNNFIDNSFDVSSNSRQNYNTYEANYWSSYDGYDIDKDGIGDVPHQPVRLFSIIIDQQPHTLILIRSLVMDFLDLAERAFPSLIPVSLLDHKPKMSRIYDTY